MSLISSILIFINNPFGIGPALFINEYHNAISYVYDSALALKIPANYSEIIFSLETGISLWPKGTMASLLPQYGIFSLILFLLTYFIIVRSVFVNTKIQTQDIFVILIGQTMFFQYTFFCNGETEYLFYFAIANLLIEYEKHYEKVLRKSPSEIGPSRRRL